MPGGGDESYPGYEIPRHKQKLEVRQPFIPGFLPSFLSSVTFSKNTRFQQLGPKLLEGPESWGQPLFSKLYLRGGVKKHEFSAICRRKFQMLRITKTISPWYYFAGEISKWWARYPPPIFFRRNFRTLNSTIVPGHKKHEVRLHLIFLNNFKTSTSWMSAEPKVFFFF